MTEIIPGLCYSCTGDITQIHTDAIVNAANSSLLGGGGVDGAIHRAAGPKLLAACRQLREKRFPDGLPAGSAVATSAGALHAKCVIHTVGPIWHGGGEDEEQTLAAAYRSCFSEARALSCRSIAFPAISTGVYGFPKDLAALTAWKEILNHLESNDQPRRVLMVFFSRSDERIFIKTATAHRDLSCH